MNETRCVEIDYFSDVLCIWAYVAQIKLDQLRRQFGSSTHLHCHYLSLFGDVEARIARGWRDRGGYSAYNAHVLEIARSHPYVEVDSGIWLEHRPPSSLGCHLFLKAIALLLSAGVLPTGPQSQWTNRTVIEEAAWRLRVAFFRDRRNIADITCQRDIATDLGVPLAALEAEINSGRAFAALSSDIELAEKLHVEGSPTLILNQGRQKLYGDIGYKVIEANIHELLERPGDRATWC